MFCYQVFAVLYFTGYPITKQHFKLCNSSFPNFIIFPSHIFHCIFFFLFETQCFVTLSSFRNVINKAEKKEPLWNSCDPDTDCFLLKTIFFPLWTSPDMLLFIYLFFVFRKETNMKQNRFIVIYIFFPCVYS